VGNARGGFLPAAATANDGASRAQRVIQTLLADSGFGCLRPEHGGSSLHVPVSPNVATGPLGPIALEIWRYLMDQLTEAQVLAFFRELRWE